MMLAMVDPPDDNTPEPDAETLRELIERWARGGSTLSPDELRQLRKWVRPHRGARLRPEPKWTWPKPEPFPRDPPGSDVPLRNDPE